MMAASLGTRRGFAVRGIAPLCPGDSNNCQHHSSRGDAADNELLPHVLSLQDV